MAASGSLGPRELVWSATNRSQDGDIPRATRVALHRGAAQSILMSQGTLTMSTIGCRLRSTA